MVLFFSIFKKRAYKEALNRIEKTKIDNYEILTLNNILYLLYA